MNTRMFNMRINRFLLGSVLILFLSNSPLYATDNPFNVQIEPASRISYEPFSGLAGVDTLKVKLGLSQASTANIESTSQQNSGRNFRIRFRMEDNSELFAFGEKRKLPISISPATRARGFKQVANEYRQDFRINGRLRARQFDFLVGIPESIFAEPGNYTLPLLVELIDVETLTVLDEQRFDIEAFVNIQMQTNIAGTHSRPGGRVRVPVVDFDVLETGESKRVSIQVRANALASITVKSKNKGRLRHRRSRGLYVDYSVSVDGETSTLKNPLILTRSVAKTIRGSAYPMDITIGDVNGAFAGSYRDTITVEVRPQ